MNVRVEKSNISAPAAAANRQPLERIVGFDAEKFKAPFILRCGAALSDYMILISAPALAFFLSGNLGNKGAKLINSQISIAGWLIAALILLSNFLILPAFTGRTIGKALCGLQIVRTDGRLPNFLTVILRHFIGYPLSFALAGLGFIFAAFNWLGRGLHDYLAGTVVVKGSRRIVVGRPQETVNSEPRRLNQKPPTKR